MYFFIRKLLYVIGLLSSTLTIIGFSNKNYTNYISDNYLYILVFIIIASLYLSRERNSININISPKVKLTIKYNDIFSEKGIVIIPVNDYFDTLVDDEIISRNTLHGKFINKFYSDDINQLNNQIKKELRNHHGEKIPSRKHGNKVRYPLGTTIKIRRDDQVFFLVAFTRFDKNNRAQLTNLEYQETVIKLIDFIENNSNGYKLNIPLLGAGHSGVNVKKQQLLEFLIFSLKIKDNLTLINGVNIILSKDLKKELSLKLINYYYHVT